MCYDTLGCILVWFALQHHKKTMLAPTTTTTETPHSYSLIPTPLERRRQAIRGFRLLPVDTVRLASGVDLDADVRRMLCQC